MIYVILGQTASGKTDLAIKIARELNMPLIGADAFQVYKELNIGSAKPSKEELNGIDYHLIDDVSVKDPINVKTYQEKVRALFDHYLSSNQDVILSGGTFLYVKAALFPYEFTSEEEKEDDGLESLSDEELLSKLKSLDSDTYDVIDHKNIRRVIRAIRIAQSGTKKSEIIRSSKPIYPCKFFSIEIDKDNGNEKIDKRVDEMFSLGLIDEVKDLLSEYDSDITPFQAIGYKEIIAGLKDNQSVDQMKEQVKIDTRQYAKRQRTFLRHQFPDIHFLSKDDIYEYIKYDFMRRKRNKISLVPSTLTNIEKAHVVLVGLGGVGSIIASGLVRLGVNYITLIDKDVVDVSNMNRQLLYVREDIGSKKAEVCKKHLLDLDPYSHIDAICDFYKDEYIPTDSDFIFDCIDDVPSKAKLIAFARKNNIHVISATGSGLRKDATKFKIGKLSMTGEPLAHALKLELRKLNISDFENIDVCYSSETPIKRITKEIGSNFVSPNGEGLALLSAFINYFSV